MIIIAIIIIIIIIRPHRMHSVHNMRPISIDVARSVVFVSVCVSVTRMYYAQTAEPIEMPFRG